MAQPYIGEIRMFAGNYAPVGWEFCDGQLLPIANHDVLFTIIGTTYGGDGQNDFALPNMQSRVPVHPGNGVGFPEEGGVESVTLTTQQIPLHTHPLTASTADGNATQAGGNLPATSLNVTPYINAAPDGPMNAGAIAPTGGSQPHENRQPMLAINFIIAMVGLFPNQT